MCEVGPYVPGMIPQTRPKDGAKLYPFNGQMLRLSDIAVATGIPTNTLRTRLASGKTLEQAFRNTDYRGSNYKPPKKSIAKKYLYHGEYLTIKEISERSGVNINAIYSRFYSGWEIDDLGKPVKIERSKK